MTRSRLHWLSPLPHRIALVALALAWLSGCVVAQSPEPTTPPQSEYPPEQGYPPESGPPQSGPYQPEEPYSQPPQQPPQQGMDCSRRPSFACCKALTAECNACMDQARAAQEQWDRECAQAGPVQPAPSQPGVDCSRAPERMCCSAQTAECNECKRQAAVERRAWAQQCGVKAPPAAPPQQPAVDCSQPPGRMCCQAETDACRSCKRQDAAERAAWAEQCQ
jgi:hypothetical protein